MSVENLKANGTQTQNEPKPAEKEKEVAALSVKGGEAVKLAINKSSLLPGSRPIEASHLNIVSTYNSIGTPRPIVASGMNIKGTLTISGNRPIAVSGLKVSETYTVMGNRPVASNEIDDPAILMGYLD